MAVPFKRDAALFDMKWFVLSDPQYPTVHLALVTSVRDSLVKTLVI